ncbi:MAG: hypothetical protein KOO60_07320 [Gemmatimonadales bacterium]|nr:hypothetical protein [Gemmatimonadales bacterium]
MSKENTVELGMLVRDKITGFEGIAFAETRWIHGCTRIQVQPRVMHEGKPIDPRWFDVPQLEIVSAEIAIAPDAEPEGKKPGGPQSDPVRMTGASR